MKKSELKQLIKEVITEVQSSNIAASERRKIANEMHKHPELGGNVKVDRLGKALTLIGQALDRAGFQLDMVTGDLLLGDKGQRTLPYSRKSNHPDPFQAGEEVSNSRIAIAWDKLGGNTYEVVAYVT